MANTKKLKKSQSKRKELQRQLDDSANEIARLRAQLAGYQKDEEIRQMHVAGLDHDKVEAHFRQAIAPPETIEEVQALDVQEPEVVVELEVLVEPEIVVKPEVVVEPELVAEPKVVAEPTAAPPSKPATRSRRRTTKPAAESTAG